VAIRANALLLRGHVIQPALLGTDTDLWDLHPSIARRNSGASRYPVVAMVDQPLMHQFSLPEGKLGKRWHGSCDVPGQATLADFVRRT
jgi:hypothetical protein